MRRRGHYHNRTVSFTVPQVLAVADRHRLGARRARAAGIEPGKCYAVIMIGRLDDYIREVAADSRSGISEADIRLSGLAIAKRAYAIFKKEELRSGPARRRSTGDSPRDRAGGR